MLFWFPPARHDLKRCDEVATAGLMTDWPTQASLRAPEALALAIQDIRSHASCTVQVETRPGHRVFRIQIGLLRNRFTLRSRFAELRA